MTKDTKEFFNIIDELMNQPTVMQLRNFKQHYSTTRYMHSLHVSYYCYVVCKKFHLDYVSAARAGLLHDLFLYDWRITKEKGEGMHAFRHPRIALENAKQITTLNAKEEDMILKHMWPLATSLPKYKETFIITLVDKYCTLTENWDYCKNLPRLKKMYQYTYILLAILLLRG